MGPQRGGGYPPEVSRVRQTSRRLLSGAVSLVSVFAILAIVAGPAAAVNVIKWGGIQDVDPPYPPGHALNDVSCPTKRLCATVGATGHVFVSTNPRGGASTWFSAKESDTQRLNAVSCTPSLCVAGDALGRIVVSTHPSSKTATWSGPTTIDGSGLTAISCPTSSLCVAADESGQVVTSTNPTGGTGAWTPAPVDPAGHIISSISCPSTSFCVAVDNKGTSLSSTDPTSGTWTLHAAIDSTNDLAAVSCPSTKLCGAVDQTNTGGRILTTTQPATNAAWKVQFTDGHFHTPFGVSCASPTLCIAIDDNGNAFTSINPTGGKSAWSTSTHRVDPRGSPESISCSPTALCVTSDSLGYVVAGQLPVPDTKITSSTISKSKHTATFAFKAVGYGSGFECALRKKGAKATFSPCSSPKSYKNLKSGSYTFLVRAVNPAGRDPSPASQGFKL